MGPLRACEESDNFSRFEDPLVIRSAAQRGGSREHEQQLFVGVMEMERGDHRARLQLVKVRSEPLTTGVPSEADGAQDGPVLADLGVSCRCK